MAERDMSSSPKTLITTPQRKKAEVTHPAHGRDELLSSPLPNQSTVSSPTDDTLFIPETFVNKPIQRSSPPASLKSLTATTPTSSTRRKSAKVTTSNNFPRRKVCRATFPTVSVQRERPKAVLPPVRAISKGPVTHAQTQTQELAAPVVPNMIPKIDRVARARLDEEKDRRIEMLVAENEMLKAEVETLKERVVGKEWIEKWLS